jgi:hypothetical protein
MRVEPDDVLNVRSGPGVENEVVATLAPDATDIEMVSTFSDSVSGQLWRQIITPQGVAGWVNLAYLTAQADLSDAMAEVLALDALDFLAGDAIDTTVVGRRGIYVGGIGVFGDAYTSFVHVDPDPLLIDELIDWTPFPDHPDCGDDCLLSTRQFLDVAEIIDRVRLPVVIGLSKDVSIEDQFLYGPIDQLSLFDALHSVTVDIPATNDGDLDWRVYHLWVDWADGTPRVIAIWRWGWTP